MDTPPVDASRTLLTQAKFLVERKRYADALKLLSRAIGIDPEFHDLYCQLSESFQGLKKYKEALEAAEGAVRTYPTAACGHQRRSILLREMGRLEESLSAAKESLKHSPQTPESHYAYALTLETLDRYDEAEAAADETVRCGPDRWHGFYLKARFAERRKEYQMALDYFEKALSFESENVTFLQGSARMLHKLNRIREAIKRYEMSVRADPTNSELAQCLRTLRQLLPAIEPSKMSSTERAAWKALAAHQTDAAQAYGIELLKSDSTQAAGLRILGSVEYQRENWPASERFFKHAVALSPNNFISINGLANAYLYQGRATEAKPLYRKILDHYSQNRVFHLNWALACVAEGLHVNARPWITRAWAWGLFRLVQGIQTYWRLKDRILL